MNFNASLVTGNEKYLAEILYFTQTLMAMAWLHQRVNQSVFLLIQVSMHFCYCCLETPHQQSQAPLPGSFTESLAWGNEGSLEMPPPPLPASVSDSASKSSHSTGNFLQLTKHYV